MTRWPTAALGDLCEINVGRTPSRSRPEYWGPSTPWLSIADMNQGLEIVSTKETITDLAVAEATAKPVQPGTVLFSFKLSIGKVGIAQRPMYTNEAIAALPVKPGVPLLPEYLIRALQASDFSGGANRAAMGATLNKEKLQQIPIPIRPLTEQRRLAATLDQADLLCTMQRQAVAHLDHLAKSLFDEALSVPDGLETVALTNLVAPDDKICYGVLQPGPHIETGIPMIRVSDIRYGRVVANGLKLISPEIEKRYSRSRIRGNEVLLSCVGSIGAVATVDVGDIGRNIARAVARIPITNSVDREYVAAYLKTPVAQRYFQAELRTVAQPTLNVKQIGETRVPWPMCSVREALVQRLHRVQDVVDTRRCSAAETQALFHSLQSRAFSGQL